MNSNKKTLRITGLLYMLNVYKHYFLFAAAVFLLQPQALIAEKGIKGNLVSVNWLEKNLKNAGLLLLDVSPARINPMHQSLAREIGMDHHRSRSSVFAVVGIAAVISLLYLFLNAATRGYFRSSLQWGAVAILVIGALVVMAIA